MPYLLLRTTLSLAVALATATATAAPAGTLLHHLSREPDVQVMPLQHAKAGTRGWPALLHVDEHQLDAANGARLLARVREGVPVLVLLADAPLGRDRGLLPLTGIRPAARAVVLTHDARDGLQTTVVQMDDPRLASAAIAGLVVQDTRQRTRAARAVSTTASAGGTADTGSGYLLAPQKGRIVNVLGLNGQIDAIMRFTIIRDTSRTGDSKTVMVKTTTSIQPDRAGITNGSQTGQNLWASRLPVKYTLGHALVTEGPTTPVLDTYLPEADGRSEFSYSRTDNRTFSIAGSLGTEYGGGTTPEQALTWTAKSPLSVNASYDIGTSETLSHTFQDYSLRVASQSPTVRWELPLAGRLGQHVLVRPTAGLPIFRPEALTPMMRNATMQALSVWHLPGTYEGVATFRHEGGFTLHEDRWHYQRARLVRGESTTVASDTLTVQLDMGGWELAREIPVLLQAVQGVGHCMRAEGEAGVRLAPCDIRDDRMMWGFDAARRYRNLNTGRCLAYLPDQARLGQQPCALANAQMWEWRADRLHSAFDMRWRLYVNAGGQPALRPDGSFVLQDLPVNQYNALDIPWSSYPSPPSLGDTMPNFNGAPSRISDEWVTRYDAEITPSQRWRTIVVSRALQAL